MILASNYCKMVINLTSVVETEEEIRTFRK